MKILIIFLLYLFLFSGCHSQSTLEKQYICKQNCIMDGYQNGEWFGMQYCNCYNSTIISYIFENNTNCRSGLPPNLNVTDLLAYRWSQKHESWKRYQDIAKDAL